MSGSNNPIGGNIKQNISKIAQSMNNVLVIFVVFKIMRIGLSYASLLIARNFTAQIYMDKVLVQDENPPHLQNFIYLYGIIEFIMSIISLLTIYSLDAIFDLKIATSSVNIFAQYLIPDLIVSSALNIVLGLIIANKMYDKKYFLYKDDGLRAIRALTDIMTKISFVILLIPFNFIFKGIYSLVKDM